MKLPIIKNQSFKNAKNISIAMDLEWFDQTDGRHLKEVGLALHAISEDGMTSISQHHHWIIQQHIHMRNRYVKQPKKPFLFASSELVDLSLAVTSLKSIFSLSAEMESQLILHNGSQDKRVLLRHGLGLDQFPFKAILDTGDLTQKYLQRSQKISLENACIALQVPVDSLALHNAGNDAAYTLELFLALNKM
jgi:hypothetical protein